MTFAADLHNPGSKSPITHKALLVAEGRDTFGFLVALLRHLQLDNTIEVRNAGGVSHIPAYLKVLTAISGFEQVAALGVVRDCEQNPAGALQSVQTALTNAGLHCPAAAAQFATGTPQTAIFLLPDAATPGMLETLCWRAVSNDPVVPCVDDYLRCVKQKSGRAVAAIEKSRVFAYIAAQEQPQLLLGQAATAGYFPWDSVAFDSLKTFVRALAEKAK